MSKDFRYDPVEIIYDVKLPKYGSRKLMLFNRLDYVEVDKLYMLKLYALKFALMAMIFIILIGLAYTIYSRVRLTTCKIIFEVMQALFIYNCYKVIKSFKVKNMKRIEKLQKFIRKNLYTVILHPKHIVTSWVFVFSPLVFALINFCLKPNPKIHAPWLFYNIQYRPKAGVFAMQSMYLQVLTPLTYYTTTKLYKPYILYPTSPFKNKEQWYETLNEKKVITFKEYLSAAGVIMLISFLSMITLDILIPVKTCEDAVTMIEISLVTCLIVSTVSTYLIVRKLSRTPSVWRIDSKLYVAVFLPTYIMFGVPIYVFILGHVLS